ncbi:uncharacterized protein EAF01_003092 [Botrytis porri]|uniref:uncharacterized protein n=1 Tax=Botrytis porri TaxID=87229 RepID=UPI001902583F|nr:uncharacterized protein EAF01_003092 [Botrytis porri]KAF7909374.1 hypothetical protein EAF01_003092 [Botrytis porri]
MDDYEDSEEIDSGLPDENDDHSTLKPCQQRLGLSSKYVRNWTKSNAFREFCQNWNGAMSKTSRVSRDKLNYVHTKLANGFRITVHNPDTSQILGFLVFDKKKGMLELCNYNSQLAREVLDMGGTSKADDDEMAGTHGEGFKLAALLMIREGYQVRITASKFYWNFRWGIREKKTLWCFLSEVKKKPTQQELNPQNTESSLFRDASPWKDVSVKMGCVRGKQGKPITEAEVMEWLKVCIHFDRPKEIVFTPSGNLILDPNFGGKVYLKGLFLEKTSRTHAIKYGYDFSQGHIGRDRKGIEDPDQMATLLAEVWKEAVQKNGSRMLDMYINMLLEKEKAWDDTIDVDNKMTRSIAKAIWSRLQKKKDNFYYGSQNAAKDSAIIKSLLKKEPVLLPDRLWKTLTKYELPQTPLEYRKNIMCNSQTAPTLDTPYCASLMRTLRAALALDPQTQPFLLVFKKAGISGLDSYLDVDNSKLLLHEKWMDFEKSHGENSTDCSLSHMRNTGDVISPIEIFSCDHIIIEICNQVLQELDRIRAGKGSIGDRSVDSLKSQVSECLKDMMQGIQALPGPQKGEICVSWEDNEAEKLFRLHRMKLQCCVTLHRESTCSHKRSELLARESYFPMVSRAHTPIAFFGFPPAAQKPAQNQSVTVVNTPRRSYVRMKPNLDEKGSQLAPANDKKELSEALGKVQKANTELTRTKQTLSSCGLRRDELNQKVISLQSQKELASVEFDKIKADNASKISQIHELEARIQELTSHLDTANFETAGLKIQLATIQSEKKTLQQRLDDVQIQINSSHSDSEAQETIHELQNRVRRMKLKIGESQKTNERLREDKRVLEARAIEAESQRAAAILQRNEFVIERYEASIQEQSSSQSTATFSRQSSITRIGRVAGIKRGRIPSMDLRMREESVMRGATSNSHDVNEDLEMYGASHPRHMSTLVKSERQSGSGTGRLVKKLRMESREVIDLSED